MSDPHAADGGHVGVVEQSPLQRQAYVSLGPRYGRHMSNAPRSWLIVLGTTAALSWVESNARMAFRDHITAGRLRKGDRFALYVTRGAGNNPGRDCAQVLAVGSVTSDLDRRDLEVLGETYHQSVRLAFDAQPLPYRWGADFRLLVPQLEFITKKGQWFAYVRKSLVPIPARDLATIDAAVSAARNRNSQLPNMKAGR